MPDHSLTLASPRSSNSDDDDDIFHSPRSNTDFDRSRSPSLDRGPLTIDSTTALILLPDSEDEITAPFNFSDEESDSEDVPSLSTRRSHLTPSIPPLPPSSVFIYLLSPYLSLGALLLASTPTPLKYALPALCVFAVLSAFVRQLWYMLGRYCRTGSMEDVVVDAFTKRNRRAGASREKDVKKRKIVKGIVRFGTGILRVLIATMYLQDATTSLLPLLPRTLEIPSVPLETRPTLVFLLALLVLPLSLPTTLSAKRVIWATWTSVVLFVAFVICAWVRHAQGTLELSPMWVRKSGIWEGISVIAFAFTSPNTLPLYASLKGYHQPILLSSPTTKTPKRYSFRTLSLLSTAISFLLILPLVFFSASPDQPETSSLPPNPFLTILSALILLLRIPSTLITAPNLPLPLVIRKSTTPRFQDNLSRCLLWIPVLVLGLLGQLGVGRVGGIVEDLSLFGALVGSFALPAIIHITTHHFKKPLSIVVPSTPLSTSHSHSHSPSSTTPVQGQRPWDELLQRKERALQKRRLRYRLGWDLGAWIVVLGCAMGIGWAAGRLTGRW